MYICIYIDTHVTHIYIYMCLYITCIFIAFDAPYVARYLVLRRFDEVPIEAPTKPLDDLIDEYMRMYIYIYM